MNKEIIDNNLFDNIAEHCPICNNKIIKIEISTQPSVIHRECTNCSFHKDENGYYQFIDLTNSYFQRRMYKLKGIKK